MDGQGNEKGFQQDGKNGSRWPSSLGLPPLLLWTCFTPSEVKGTQATALTLSTHSKGSHRRDWGQT